MRDPEITTFFKELPEEERQEMLTLWNEAGYDYQTATQDFRREVDTEGALANVQQRLGIDSAGNSGKKDTSSARPLPGHPARRLRRPFLLYALLAATLLISFGMFWLTQPVRTYVPAGEMLSLALPDGSQARLNSGTELFHNRLFGYTNRNVQLNGEAYFEVQRSDVPFRVEANGSLTEVLGTSFNLRSWRSDPARQTELTVTSGRVSFQRIDGDGNGVLLTEGFSSELRSDMTRPSEPVSADIAPALAWTQHQLAFTVQPLSVIFAELERKFDIEIQWDDPRIGRSTLSSFYNEPESAESVLRDICTVKGLSYTKTATGYRIHF